MESQKASMNILSSHCQINGPKILDIGCGSGYFINTLSDIYSRYTYTGVDLNEQYLNIGRDIYNDKDNVSFHCGDAQKLDFKTDQFDIVISVNTFPHIPSIKSAIKEAIRVSRKYILIRLLIDKELTIVKKSLDFNLDANGEPTNYMLVNTYTKEYIKKIIGNNISYQIIDDNFDPNALIQHHKNHKNEAGEHIATKVKGGKQQKGIIVLNWKFLFIEL